MSEVHYLNGSWVGRDELKISAFDLAFSRGLAVFDTMRTYGNKVYKIEQHLGRLEAGAAKLNIKIPVSNTELVEIINRGISKNSFNETVVKVTVTAGINEGMLSSSNPSIVIIFSQIKLPSKDKYDAGVKLISTSVKRSAPEIKTIDYVAAKMALMEAQSTGADDAIYLDGDKILETTISNIFFVNDNKLYTPKLDGVLAGITRSSLLELAEQESIEVTEKDILITEISNFDECFICSSIKEIIGVVSINEKLIGDGKVGEFTKELSRKFHTFASSSV